jgi:phosphonate transport system ATP-binding protein
MALLAELAHSENLAVAAVLHQPDLAIRHADRAIGLLRGKIAFDGGMAGLTDSVLDALYAPDRVAA